MAEGCKEERMPGVGKRWGCLEVLIAQTTKNL